MYIRFTVSSPNQTNTASQLCLQMLHNTKAGQDPVQNLPNSLFFKYSNIILCNQQ